MNARDLLESFGDMLDRSALLARETAMCKRHIQKDAFNADYWHNKAKRNLAERKRLQTQLERRQKQLNYLLSSLPDEAQRQVLALRYISLMSYAQISETLHFSVRHIYRLHLKGVKALDALMS
ncbi:MAG: sigma-70 family RNA polymerase sigma factor [Clostridiales bacterium]|nr:sigma-70 family RNA polymerase sigma factor [Clostridiales bacterium]